MAEAVKKPSADEVYQGLTGTQKCAILMMLIGCLLYTSPSPRDNR